MKTMKALSFLMLTVFVGAFGGCEAAERELTDPAIDPEGMCTTWSKESCTAISACCGAEKNFDQFRCEIFMSSYCLDNMHLEYARSDQYVFDQASAQACLTPITECDPPEPTTQHPEACANMITGYRPLGAGCSATSDCERPASGRAHCYDGKYGDGGVCVRIAESTNGKCSFSKETLLLSTCPENTYCDDANIMMSVGEVPSDYMYEFEADCKPYRANGESCLQLVGNDPVTLPCQEGLYCKHELMDFTQAKCAPRKEIGQPCESPGECVEGASCDYASGLCVAKKSAGIFCHVPPVCGDGDCSSGETPESCIADCGYCGDGTCGTNEPNYCFEDCGGYCGDGICTPPEEGSCNSDCPSPACVTCGEYISNFMGDLCPGTSDELFLAFGQCACAGPCATACQNNFCTMSPPSAECAQCAQDTVQGCGMEFNACYSD